MNANESHASTWLAFYSSSYFYKGEMTMNTINGSEIRCVYRATAWTKKLPVRLFVTRDNRIWVGYGDAPLSFSHVANVGDRNTSGRTRRDILEAANA
jgi:hypothetical protein